MSKELKGHAADFYYLIPQECSLSCLRATSKAIRSRKYPAGFWYQCYLYFCYKDAAIAQNSGIHIFDFFVTACVVKTQTLPIS